MSPRPLPPTPARTALSVALLALLYLWVFPYHAAVNNPNENVRVYMTVAVVDDGTFAINRIERDWGYVNDKSVREGKLYSSKAPGASYLGVPVYWLLTKLTGRDSHPVAAAPAAPPRPATAARAPHPPPPRQPIDRTLVVYVLRLVASVLPALLFAWFWHRFLGARTASPALREAVFFSTMAGSSLFAYSEMFVGHAHNAYCIMGALMAIATARERAADDPAAGAPPRASLGLFFVAGLLGAAATLFEYPAAIATGAVALWILATCAERRRVALAPAALALGAAAAFAATHHKAAAVAAGLAAVGAYALTLSPRAAARLAAAGAGGAAPAGLVMLYHWRCFGSPFKPGYSYLENPTFHAETAQGFFGATRFSWEAGLRMWLDPAFGLIPSTPLLAACVAGFASYLALAPDRGAARTPAARHALRAVLAAAALYAAARALLAYRAHPAPPTPDDAYVGVALCAAALVALGMTALPRPRRSDVSLGAVMLFITYGMTRLIGMMNNWRGGWQVGPRYLVTIVPVLGLAALAGLDALWRRGPAGRRAATVFAAGATLAAFLVTGFASAYFPHIPTEYGSPFFEMVVPLVRDGFAPHNAGHLLGLAGPASLAGAALAAAAMAVIVLRGDEWRPLAAMAHALAGAAVAVALLVPLAAAARPETAGVTRYVKGAFEPRPPDDPRPGAAAPARESPGAARARGRRLAVGGDGRGALEAYLRAIRGREGGTTR